jgi:glycosyltransferase involved in cell wall biosynthesis
VNFEVTDILSLIKGPDWVPDQWRTIEPFHRLRQAGINARYAWGDDDQWLPTDPESTVLVMGRQTATDEATVDRWFAERRPNVRAIVYECDDLIFDERMLEHLQLSDFMQGETPEQILHEARMARYFAQQCDGVTASSEHLAERIRRFTDKPVICVPNAIDVRNFRARMAYRAPWADHLTIGWSGGRRPERDIVPMAQAWGRIARRYPSVRFVVAAPVTPDVFYREIEDDSRIIRLPWLSWHDYPVAYQTDIGCCSVADTVFSRCKTPIKAMEYAVAGAAVVATPTLYNDVVFGYGLLATTADEWETALVFYIEHADERRLMARELATEVERRYSLDVNLYRWTDAYRAIVKSMAGVPA